ncbi:MAG: GlsB/YeaQ/YmgE family stress response membrane protein [Verrucomicrobiales bacterium]|nr:GlsB/YeaQ/YmgE family stress response membrane protein [Verrucomicrobiales bacterium]
MIITDILVWIALGLVMGYIARAILPGEQKIGLIPTILVGAAGAFIGAYVGRMFGIEVSNFNLMSILAAIAGSIIVLIIWCFIAKKLGK